MVFCTCVMTRISSMPIEGKKYTPRLLGVSQKADIPISHRQVSFFTTSPKSFVQADRFSINLFWPASPVGLVNSSYVEHIMPVLLSSRWKTSTDLPEKSFVLFGNGFAWWDVTKQWICQKLVTRQSSCPQPVCMSDGRKGMGTTTGKLTSMITEGQEATKQHRTLWPCSDFMTRLSPGAADVHAKSRAKQTYAQVCVRQSRTVEVIAATDLARYAKRNASFLRPRSLGLKKKE